MNLTPRTHGSNENAAALIIVLAFVVLLSGLVVAYFSRTVTDRGVAKSSFTLTKADQVALSATNLIISDLKQEIVSGSTLAVGNSGTAMYIANPTANMVPQRSGNPPLVAGIDPVPNLIRRSVYPDSIVAPGIASRASAVNTTSTSVNKRTVTTTRWNSHYLIPKKNTTDDTIPVDDFLAPDWVIVTRNGPTVFTGFAPALKDPTTTNNSYAMGRYAYAIYDEGGLLDINIAGFPITPSPPSLTDIGRKGIVAFANLTALKTTPSNSFVSNIVIDRIVGWRNYATMQPSAGTFPSSLSFTAAGVTNFVNYFLGAIPHTGTTVDFGSVKPAGATRTDQGFISRKELIKLRSDTQAGAASMLQYLGTFSREQNAPTWRPNSFSNSTAYPLGTRFPLSNLALVVANPTGSAATAIKTNFGLKWSTDHWQYVGTSASTQLAIAAPTAGTPPDFFQYLSFARTNATGLAPTILETLSTGASIIDQYDSDSITTKIEYAVPAGKKTNPAYAYGMESLSPPNPSDAPAFAPPGSVINRPFRNVGEIGYAFKNSNPATAIDFRTADFPLGTNLDAGLLDFFTYNTWTTTPRSGIVNLNTRNASVLAAILMGSLAKESSSTGISQTDAMTAATNIVAETANTVAPHGPAVGRADLTRLASAAVVTNSPFTADEESREAIARALAEVGQTRTWGLFIDVIAQSGRYSPAAAGLADFSVEGEQRYWVHVAIDRFTGNVVDRQVEVVKE